MNNWVYVENKEKSTIENTVNRTVKEQKKATTAGFEPARAKPNRFLVCLLNHSDKLS